MRISEILGSLGYGEDAARQAWYGALTKPSWTPEPATIGTIWSVLYPLIAVTHGFVIVQALRGRIPKLVALPFVINLVANVAFTPLFFGARSILLAELDILVVLGTIVWSMAVVWRHYRWVALVQIPYLAWVTIATILQTSILFANGS